MVLLLVGKALKVAAAISLSLVQPIYNEYNQYASQYDGLNSGKIANDFGIQDLRKEVRQYATGKVLDVAVGTGLQNSFYDWTKINSYSGNYYLDDHDHVIL